MKINFSEHKECAGCFWQPYREIMERERTLYGNNDNDLFIIKSSKCNLCQIKKR